MPVDPVEQDAAGDGTPKQTPAARDTVAHGSSRGEPSPDPRESAARPMADTSRVRFSLERPSFREASAQSTEIVGSTATVGAAQAAPKRNRGYSLRRSLFAQNLHKQDVSRAGAFELHASESPSQAGKVHAFHYGAPPPCVSVQEDDEDPKSRPSASARLSDPGLDLPVYRRWLSKEHSRSLVHTVTKRYLRLRDRIGRATTIPPSADGRHVRVNAWPSEQPLDERTGKPYVNNVIRSCRYTPWNFVPRQLVAQFGKLANFYFLCVSILQMIPDLSTTGTYTTIVPLLIFVSISMAKEGYDDVRRHRLDKEENERPTEVLELNAATKAEAGTPSVGWAAKKWSDVRVGDVVRLQRDTAVPADLILLHADEPTGTAYIETKSLDGETNLKAKKPVADVSAACRTSAGAANLAADFVVEDPNPDLYKFDGRVAYGGQTLPLTNSEILYRGSVLRNTPSALGLVIHTGEECKIRMNANKSPRIKAPTLQGKVNRVVIFVAALVLFMAIILTVAYQIWCETTEEKSWYLQAAQVPFSHILISFIIMLNTMLPLSLYVSLEIVKVAQMFLMNDVDMYDPVSDTPMEPHTSTINEELGQVSYIFSDKTGTLTNNSMKFRKMSIAGTAWLHDPDLRLEAADDAGREKLKHKKRGGKSLDPERKGKSTPPRHSIPRNSVMSSRESAPSPARTGGVHEERNWEASTGVEIDLDVGKTQDLVEFLRRRPHSIFARKARFFLLSLALCHTCMPETDPDGAITYQAASPDELALVTAAQDMGVMVTNRQPNSLTVKMYAGGDEACPIYESYDILHVIEFSSSRKRMSIVVRLPDRRICLLTKGADTTIRGLLRLADLASTSAKAVERRASQRKSIEAQEILRRRSTQMSRRSGSVRVLDPVLSRESGLSLDRPQSVRDSIDQWLKEREKDPAISRHRRSFQVPTLSPPSTRLPARRSESHAGRAPVSSPADPHPSRWTDGMDALVDDSVVLDDNVVFARCFQHIDDFATEGLRTLLYGSRFVSEDEYREWKEVYVAATTSIVDRQDKIERAAEMLEHKLELVGATAIEDKLQKGVPDAIDRLRRAGIKMWMLTGDKRETAINIGHSCRLIKDYSTTIVLDHTLGELNRRMAAAFAQFDDANTVHSVLVVDGQTLTIIDADPASRALFTDLAIRADSVICCRASPSQKASLVKSVRMGVKGSVTLAVGDGANDIAMIQEAHVGIGIAGKEGLQAARTSDYSIAQFRFLLKLLLVHGRWNYVRICKYTLGTFWKEMLFYSVQALYQRWNGYTGTSLYEPWSMSMFNTLFTSLPVICMGIFEKDLAASTLLAVPELYSIGQHNRGFNFPLYFWWAGLGAVEAVMGYFIVYGLYGEALFSLDQGLYAMGALAFSGCVIVISLKLQCVELHNKSVAAAVAIFLSVGGWWLWNLILSCIYRDSVVYTVKHGFLSRFGRNPLWWLTLLVFIAAILLLEVLLKAVIAAFWPSDVDVFQGWEQDREVRKRFEEAAADLLQEGWNRGTKKSSLEISREAAMQAEREAQVQQLLDRPRTMEEGRSTFRTGASGASTARDPQVSVQHVGHSHEMEQVPRPPVDVGDIFSKGFGMVRKGTMGTETQPR